MEPIPDMSRDFPRSVSNSFSLFLFLELCLMDRVSFGEAGSGLNPLFPQPVSGVGASHLSGAQKRQRRGKELAIQAFPEVGFLRGQRDGLSLSPLSPIHI